MGRMAEAKKRKYVRRQKRVYRRAKVRKHPLVGVAGSGILDITVEDIRAMRSDR